eukprot:TRINITY_DN1220_c0_g1_i2.p1 TRINITY_DN1220_c0_g1~~TRINITY_DN1220_c0_g1_i2.p1  ORF type:complete len:380 (-),score=43.12 TRINITY_DN1220_c0_g1_i2:514-1554(-)
MSIVNLVVCVWLACFPIGTTQQLQETNPEDIPNSDDTQVPSIFIAPVPIETEVSSSIYQQSNEQPPSQIITNDLQPEEINTSIFLLSPTPSVVSDLAQDNTTTNTINETFSALSSAPLPENAILVQENITTNTPNEILNIPSSGPFADNSMLVQENTTMNTLNETLSIPSTVPLPENALSPVFLPEIDTQVVIAPLLEVASISQEIFQESTTINSSNESINIPPPSPQDTSVLPSIIPENTPLAVVPENATINTIDQLFGDFQQNQLFGDFQQNQIDIDVLYGDIPYYNEFFRFFFDGAYSDALFSPFAGSNEQVRVAEGNTVIAQQGDAIAGNVVRLETIPVLNK